MKTNTKESINFLNNEYIAVMGLTYAKLYGTITTTVDPTNNTLNAIDNLVTDAIINESSGNTNNSSSQECNTLNLNININENTGESNDLLKCQLDKSLLHVELLENQMDILKVVHNVNLIDKLTLEKIYNNRIETDYEYLVFSGGGIKGIGFAGCVDELFKLNIIYSKSNEFKLKGLAGTSAGSIIASLLAIGYTPCELIEIIYSLDFGKITSDELGYMHDSYNFIKEWGMCPGDYALQLFGDLIKKKTGNPDYTIRDLYNEKQIKLVIVTTDTNFSKSVYLHPHNPIEKYSNIPIKLAIRLSIGIPFIFEPYLYNDCYFVDGGVLDNYPLHVFDGNFPGDPQARLNLCKPNPKVLGIKLMTDNKQSNYDLVNKKIFSGLFDYALSFIDTFLTENDRRMMIPSYWTRSIIIIVPNYPISKFNISDNEKKIMFEAGKKYTIEYFSKELHDITNKILL